MKITYLGQAGLLFETDSCKIMLDPYLSDSVKEIEPHNFRRVAVDESFFSVKPDVMIFTHDHLDHYDPETVKHFIGADSNITVLAPKSVYEKVRAFGGNNRYVCFDRHTEWNEKGIRFSAVKAVHSEPYAIGVIIEYLDKKYYVTGDTLYNTEIFDDIPNDIYAIFLPVNGLGNNMNMQDGVRFCERVKPRVAIPFHCGLFDNFDLNRFQYENKVIPEIYKEIKI